MPKKYNVSGTQSPAGGIGVDSHKATPERP